MNTCKIIHNKIDNPDAGKFVLRIMLGGILIFHGIHKLLYGIDIIREMLSSFGLPSFLAYGVYVGELIAPVMLILGIMTRAAALFVLINMLMAWVLADISNTFMLDEQGGLAIEGLLFYFMSALAIIFFGSGRYAVMKNS